MTDSETDSGRLDLLRSTVNATTREAIATAFVVTILAIWVAHVTGYVSVSGVRMAMVDTFFWVFVAAAAYIVFGKKAVDAAIDTVQKLRGGGGG